MNTWFTADTHFDHAELISLCRHPFKNVDRMNRILINNWNARVKPNDAIIFLGDFMFRESRRADYFIEQLHGNITFVRGNHDQNNSLNTRIESLVVDVADTKMFCVHDPAMFNKDYEINLVGHVHSAWKIKKASNSLLLNVGVDVWKYVPININEILKAITRYRQTKDGNGETDR